MVFLQFAMKDDPSERAKREKKAASAECTPLSLDVENKTGTFKGSSGIYETRIDGCPCMDCARRRLPCKHMYRLAGKVSGLLRLNALHFVGSESVFFLNWKTAKNPYTWVKHFKC